MSQQRACRIMGQHRSTQRRLVLEEPATTRSEDELCEFSAKHNRWGYRKAWAVLRDEGWTANRKKIQRL